ncbi:hypothetical protein [Alkalibacillus haloalkaliphilus]|uniref:hypothetical protein n=1 Tax=Alkalibacillus haloalkaliphilus TaxID=94136 RepID=UPI000362D134|nr:hypothetical protein [Alkalibacillus haloalkaliphilus]
MLVVVFSSVFIGLMSLVFWFYPNISSTADQKSTVESNYEKIEQYTTNLAEVEEEYDLNFEYATLEQPIGVANTLVHYIIDLIEQEVLSKDMGELTLDEIDDVLTEVDSSCLELKSLVTYEEYFSEERQYIEDSLNDLRVLRSLLVGVVE